ncbi:MAG: cold shock domain-containing protein [Bacillota bacterium]
MAKGTVRLINFERGFGFITPAQGENGDIYFHFSTLKEVKLDYLEEGDAVEYEVELIPQGFQATEVKKLDE